MPSLPASPCQGLAFRRTAGWASATFQRHAGSRGNAHGLQPVLLCVPPHAPWANPPPARQRTPAIAASRPHAPTPVPMVPAKSAQNRACWKLTPLLRALHECVSRSRMTPHVGLQQFLEPIFRRFRFINRYRQRCVRGHPADSRWRGVGYASYEWPHDFFQDVLQQPRLALRCGAVNNRCGRIPAHRDDRRHYPAQKPPPVISVAQRIP